MENKILTVANKKEEKFLRRKTEDFDFKKYSRKEIQELILKMKQAMRGAHGIGLSANQIGLDFKFFIAEVPNEKSGNKFYAIFNPKIEKLGSEKVLFEEGCLSVPLTYGTVERPTRLSLSGFDKNGKPLKIKVWGLLARIFQHEMDHLNGMLFIDRTKNIHKIPTSERLQKREKTLYEENLGSKNQ